MFVNFIARISIVMFISSVMYGQKDSNSYIKYHEGIIKAEEAFFLDEDYETGLNIFDAVFSRYDFVFVDDCIEAFQLALFCNSDSLALKFIEKAIENGFKVEMLESLNMGTPTNFYQNKNQKVTIYNDFIDNHKEYLEKKENAYFATVQEKINERLLMAVVVRHVKEQYYKNNKSKNEYYIVSNKNLDFLIYLFEQGMGIGEKNIGILREDINKYYEIPYLNENNELNKKYYSFISDPTNTDNIPVLEYQDVFDYNIVYTILFHNDKSYDRLKFFSKKFIDKGILHPRELASLKYRRNKMSDDENIFLENYHIQRSDKDIKKINNVRCSLYLPSYEIDYEKYHFGIKNGLKLNFGFFNGTR